VQPEIDYPDRADRLVRRVWWHVPQVQGSACCDSADRDKATISSGTAPHPRTAAPSSQFRAPYGASSRRSSRASHGRASSRAWLRCPATPAT
jgi:hypothetical protein